LRRRVARPGFAPGVKVGFIMVTKLDWSAALASPR